LVAQAFLPGRPVPWVFAVWKIRALFLVPVLSAAAVAAVVSYLRPPDRPWPRERAGTRRPEPPRLEGFTPDGYARYVAAFPAGLGGPDAARRAFLAAAHDHDRQVDAYRAVGPDHAAEAFRYLAVQCFESTGPRGRPIPSGNRRVPDILRELVAAHEAQCGPDPDPETVLYKAVLLVREGRYAEAEPLAARAAEAFRDSAPGREYQLARDGRLAVYVELGRWKEGAKLELPPGLTAEDVFAHLFRADRLDDAGRLLDRAAAAAPDDLTVAACRARLEYRRGDWAACLAAAERVLAPPARPDDPVYDRPDIQVLRVKALARLGRFADADRALEAVAEPRYEFLCGPAELLVALLAGDGERADRVLGGSRVTLATAYDDEELGPLLAADRFAALRAKYPRPPGLPR
jgi:tetratricopeptide (TPR) repeat protein